MTGRCAHGRLQTHGIRRCQSAVPKLIRESSREATGSAAPLHDALQHLASSNAVSRVNMSETARAHG